MASLPKGLTLESFNERHNRAFAVQATWQSLLSECYEFFIPQQNVWRFQNLSPGAKRDNRIMDGLPEDAMNEGANKVKASITPDWREWAILKPGFELPEEIRENTDVKKQLEDITKLLFSHINQSNFSIAMGEAYKDWLIGTAAVEIRENTDPTKSILSYHQLNQQFVAYEEGPFGNVENEYKHRTVAARNVESTYPGGDFSQTVKTAMKDAPTKEFEFREGYVKVDQYYLIVTEQQSDQIVWAEPQGLSNPIAVFRYAVMADEIRGRGPALSALPNSKTLNKIQEFALQKAALELAGMYTSVDDGVFNPNTVTISPGVIIPVGSNGGVQGPSLQRLDTGADLQLSLFELQRMGAQIRKALFNNLREPDDTVISASQFVIEAQELAKQIGSAFGRIQTEGLIPILNRSLEVLQRRGVVPSLTIDGRQITVQFTSPLAKAQDTEDLLSLQQAIEISTLTAGPEMTQLGFKMEEIPQFIADKTGLPIDLVRDEGEREKVKQDLAEAAALALEAQQEQQPGEAA